LQEQSALVFLFYRNGAGIESTVKMVVPGQKECRPCGHKRAF